MPLYEYECRACGKHTDIRHGFDDKNAEPCPACGGELARVFSASGIVFKGSGFYINDSRKPTAGGDSPSSSGSNAPATPAATTPATPAAPAASPAPSTGGDSSGSGATAA